MVSLTQRNLSKLWEIVQERGIMVLEVHEVWSMGSQRVGPWGMVHEATKSWTWLSDWTVTTTIIIQRYKNNNTQAKNFSLKEIWLCRYNPQLLFLSDIWKNSGADLRCEYKQCMWSAVGREGLIQLWNISFLYSINYIIYFPAVHDLQIYKL